MQTAIQSNKSILVIESNLHTRKTIFEYLNAKYICDEADCIGLAFEKVGKKNFDIIICNFELQDANALELLASTQFISPETTIILIGENTSKENIIESFRTGAFDFVQMPFALEQLEASVNKALIHCDNKHLKDGYEKRLESLVDEKNLELLKAYDDIEVSYQATLKVLLQALEARDYETHGHSERVVTFSLRLGHELGLEKAEMYDLELGALLHDIGKIGVPDSILRKPGKLTELEWDKMRLHPMQGYEILKNVPFLRGASRVVAEHHERWDGKGYPNQLRGEEIAFTARIFAVADAFDAMISERVYSREQSFEDTVLELEKNAGTQFDPKVVEAFKNVPQEDWETLHRRSQKAKIEYFSSREIVSKLVHAQKQSELIH